MQILLRTVDFWTGDCREIRGIRDEIMVDVDDFTGNGDEVRSASSQPMLVCESKSGN